MYLLYEASFWLTKRELASGSLAVLMVADLFERETIQKAERIFHLFLEQQQNQILSIISSAKATLLKTCKDLLRRIPKSNYPLLSSKISIFLCRVLPLTDRSGVNLKSEHNNTSTFLYSYDNNDNLATTFPLGEGSFLNLFVQSLFMCM